MPKTDFDFEGDNSLIGKDEDELETEDTEETEEVDFDEDNYMDDDIEEELEKEEEAEEDVIEDEAKEEPAEKVEKEEAEEEGDPYRKVREDIIKALPEGEDTVFLVKGKEYRARDIPPQEWVNVIQKGIRADQIFADLGSARREIERERELVNRGAEQVERLLQQYGQGKEGAKKEVELPSFLKPSDLDTEETRLLKQYAADMASRVTTLETGVQSSQEEHYANEILNEVKSLQKEYPVASVDEVLAVKSIHPNERIEDLMRMSNQYYSSLKFLDSAMAANPQAARELEERIIAKYNAKKSKARQIGTKRSRTSGSKKVSTKPAKRPGLDYDFDDAGADARDYLDEIRRLRSR